MTQDAILEHATCNMIILKRIFHKFWFGIPPGELQGLVKKSLPIPRGREDEKAIHYKGAYTMLNRLNTRIIEYIPFTLKNQKINVQ